MTATPAPEDASVTYQWYRSENNTTSLSGLNTYILNGTAELIEGATESTYTSTPEDSNMYLHVVVNGIEEDGYAGTKVAYKQVVPTISTITIAQNSYTNKVGTTLTTTNNAGPSDAVIEYQWYRVNSSCTSLNYLNSYISSGTAVAIDGATEDNYTLTPDDYGKYICVVAKGSDEDGYSGEAFSYCRNAVAANVTSISIASYSSQKYVGTELTTTLSPTDAVVEYQWYRANSSTTNLSSLKTAIANGNAVAIDGATASTYKAAPEDYGKYLYVIATGVEEDGYIGEVFGYCSRTIGSSINSVSIASYSSQKYVGDTLTASPSLSVSGAVVDYQWYRIDSSTTNLTNLKSAIEAGTAVAIDGATESKYSLTSEDAGKYIAVLVSGSEEDGYYGEAMAYVSKVVIEKVTSATIDGNAYVGTTLTAIPSSEDATATYKWYSRTSNSTSTSGASLLSTEKTYTLTENELGKYVFCYVSANGSYSGNVYTNVIGPVTEKTTIDLGSVSLSGTAQVGESLTAIVDPADATVEYTWYRAASADSTSWEEIAGATASTYTLTDTDEGMFIKVAATGTGDYEGTVETISSSSVIAAYKTLTSLNVETTDVVGEEMRVTYEPADATLNFQWQVSEDGSEWSDIDGATASTYKVQNTDITKYIRVQVTGTGDYTGNDYTSNGTYIPEVVADLEVTGTSRVGKTLSVQVVPDTIEVSYQWMISDSENGVYSMVGEEDTIKLTEDMGGKYIKVVGTGENLELESEPTKVLKTIKSIGIKGTPKVGKDLTVVIDPSEATGNIQWLIGDTATGTFEVIDGATNYDYTIQASDAGKWIQVMFTGTEDYEGIKVTLSSGSSGSSSSSDVIVPGKGGTIAEETTADEDMETIDWTVSAEVDGAVDNTIKESEDDTTSSGGSSSGDGSGTDEEGGEDTGSNSGSSVGSTVTIENIPENATGEIKWYYKDENGNWVEITDAAGNTSFKVTETYAGKEIKGEFVGKTEDGEDITIYAGPIYIEPEDDSDTSISIGGGECNVYVSQGQSFCVTVPAFISLKGDKDAENSSEFSIKCSGDISGTDIIKVVPSVSSFAMKEDGGIKRDLTAEITLVDETGEFSIEKDGEEELISGVVREGNKIVVENLTAGTWRGTFDWSITTEGDAIDDSEDFVIYKSYIANGDSLEYVSGTTLREDANGITNYTDDQEFNDDGTAK